MLPLSQWPAEFAGRICGVFTDIDDTLTTHGVVTPDALAALASLKQAGLHVIPITGRPIGWCLPFLDGTHGTPLPVDAMVAENGAVAYLTHHSRLPETRFASSTVNQQQPGTVMKLYQESGDTRAAHRERMQVIADRVMNEVPGVELSRDSAGRETDLAFDYGEFVQHPPATVHHVLRILQQADMRTTISSIHIHGCFGDFDKWRGARWIVREVMGRDLSEELDRWVFVGDSGNDQPMFQNFRHSFGVANIAEAAQHLTHFPHYVTQQARGAGFAEVVRSILAAR